jgi:hypothetical protein
LLRSRLRGSAFHPPGHDQKSRGHRQHDPWDWDVGKR